MYACFIRKVEAEPDIFSETGHEAVTVDVDQVVQNGLLVSNRWGLRGLHETRSPFALGELGIRLG